MHNDKPITKTTTQKFGWLDVPKSIWYFLDKDKPRWIFLNVILFVVLFYDLIPALVVGKIIDFFTTYQAGDSLHTFYFYVIFLGVAHTVISLIRLGTKNKLNKISISARSRARVSGFENLINLPLQWHAKENTGNKIERVFTGSQALREWCSFNNNTVFPVTVSFIGVLTIFMFLSPIFFLFLVAYTALFIGTEWYFNRKIAELNEEYNRSKQESTGAYVESTGNLLSIKAMGSEKHLNLRIQKTEESARDIQYIITDTGSRKWYTFQTINGISFILFFFLLGHQLIAGALTVGSIMVYYTYFDKLREATGDATDAVTKVIGLKSDLANMMPIFLEQSTVKTGHQKFPRRWDKIEIRNGDFSYPSGKKALSNVNLSLGRNEKLGIAGASGSGKSTLVKMLLGLYALEKGDFRIGDRNYYDIAHDDLIHNIAVVLQETELFNLSLRDNITGLKSVDADILEMAIDISQLKDVLKKLPDGLDTLVGEKGYKLSGGERQRLGIARAICKNAPILLLDEATSALDSKTEKKIMDKLLSKFSNEKTLIIIAHRISTLKDTDRVIVFEEGSILEEGTYDSLVANPNSHLGQLYALQSGSSSGVTNA